MSQLLELKQTSESDKCDNSRALFASSRCANDAVLGDNLTKNASRALRNSR